MKRNFSAHGLGLVLLLLAFGVSQPAYGLEIGVDVAPRIINTGGSSVTFVVHTDLAFNLVEPYSVTLNGEPIHSWKRDSLGNFDAIILLSDIAPGLEVGVENLFLLQGRTNTDPQQSFWGGEEVLVVEPGTRPGLLR